MSATTAREPQQPRATEPEATSFVVGVLAFALAAKGLRVLHADPAGFLILDWDGQQRHISVSVADCR